MKGIGRKWGSFIHKRKRLEQTMFEGVETLSLSHLAVPNDRSPTKDDLIPDCDWIVYMRLGQWWNDLHMCWIPSLIGRQAPAFLDLFRAVAAAGRATYGHRVVRRYYSSPWSYEESQTPFRLEFLDRKREWWGVRSTRVDSLLLPDLYPHNYLSRAHLSAPFGRSGRTLREWIEEDPAGRGELTP
ncbi:MAG: hypothetical protein D6692_10215, partial [Planctomycetota bacterium]